jgi:hypothetical protein
MELRHGILDISPLLQRCESFFLRIAPVVAPPPEHHIDNSGMAHLVESRRGLKFGVIQKKVASTRFGAFYDVIWRIIITTVSARAPSLTARRRKYANRSG